MEIIVKLLRVGDPLAVGRPDGVKLVVRPGVGVGIHAHGSLFVEVHVPDIQTLVGIGNLLAVGGPDGRVVERRRVAQADFSHLAQAVLVADVELILAGFIRKVGDGLAVGRPDGIQFADGRRVRKVSNVALFSRDR